MTDILFRAEHISKSFPGVRALDDVSVDIHAGQVNAIVGENGAGKSTLMKILSGVYQEYEGHLVLDGQPVSFASPKAAQEHGIAIIHQELNLIPHLNIAENVFLGREFHTRLGLIDDARMIKETRTLLQHLKLDVDPLTTIDELRVGQQQIVEIAKALSLNARIIIMDEPTSAISDSEVHVLFEMIRDLKSRGVAIVYITHKLDELFEIGDRVTVLRDGRMVDSRPLSGLAHDDIVRMMVGRDVEKFFVKEQIKSKAQMLRVRNLSLPHPQRPDDFVIKDVSFEAKQGEVLGLFGLMGAGRTELLECMFGLHASKSSGDVFVEKKHVNLSSPQQAIQAGIALVPEDRKSEGLVLNMSVAENTSLATIEQTESFGFLNASRETQLAERFAKTLNIKTPSVLRSVETLSGGNQQKVVLAKWLATDPKVLLLDEPTRGIDINAKNEIYQLINSLAQSGLAIVFVSSELPEILAIADRILVLSQGRLSGEFLQDEATEEKLLKAAIAQMRP